MTVVVTDVVWPVPQTELVITAVTQAAAVVELRGWVIVVVVVAAAVVVVVVCVTAEDAEETVFLTELASPDWLDITTLDRQPSAFEGSGSVTSLLWFSWEDKELTAAMQAPCWTKADRLVPFPFWAMLATI